MYGIAKKLQLKRKVTGLRKRMHTDHASRFEYQENERSLTDTLTAAGAEAGDVTGKGQGDYAPATQVDAKEKGYLGPLIPAKRRQKRGNGTTQKNELLKPQKAFK